MEPPTQEQLDAVDQKAQVDDSIVRATLARIPPAWNCIQSFPSGAAFKRGSLQVMISVLRYDDGRIWKHISVCGRTGPSCYHLPTWEDLKRVKNDFIGEERWAYQVLPNSKQYINQNPYVLHLYSLFEDGAMALPDFTWGLGTL